MRLLVSAVVVLIGLAGLAGGVAAAEPSSPAPAPPATSTDDELTDMVMDAIATRTRRADHHPGSGAPALRASMQHERDGLRQRRARHVVGRVSR